MSGSYFTTLVKKRIQSGARAEAGGMKWFLSRVFKETQSEYLAIFPALTADGKGVTLGGTDAVQTVTLTSASGGTFTLTFDGATTGDIAYNATTAAVKAALEALATIGAGNVAVTGTAGTSYVITFDGELAALDVPAITIDDADLTGAEAAGAVAQTTEGVAPNWDQLLRVTGDSKIKFKGKKQRIPLSWLLDDGEVVTIERGIESIEFSYAQSDIDALTRAMQLTESDIDYQEATAGLGPRALFNFGSEPITDEYRHLLGVKRNRHGFLDMVSIAKVQVSSDFDLTYGGKVIELPTKFDVLSHSGFPDDENVMTYIRNFGAPTGS